ncbi:MAG: hypothetical protein ACPGVK_05940 [Halocynthiibacter sp.]
MARLLGHALIVVLLTLTTQIGGVLWLLSRLTPKYKTLSFAALYLAVTLCLPFVAPRWGRVALPCTGDTLRSQSLFYCALNRHYVTPEMAKTVHDLANKMSTQFPNQSVQTLDGNFPLPIDFPLLPHLSHSDGRKIDLALFYKTPETHAPTDDTRSPIGYFAFEDGPTPCPHNQRLSLRWDFEWLQPYFKTLPLDKARTRAALNILADDPRVEKIFVEPHLKKVIGVSHAKMRFQGCRAARHDDHIHFQTQSP